MKTFNSGILMVVALGMISNLALAGPCDTYHGKRKEKCLSGEQLNSEIADQRLSLSANAERLEMYAKESELLIKASEERIEEYNKIILKFNPNFNEEMKQSKLQATAWENDCVLKLAKLSELTSEQKLETCRYLHIAELDKKLSELDKKLSELD